MPGNTCQAAGLGLSSVDTPMQRHPQSREVPNPFILGVNSQCFIPARCHAQTQDKPPPTPTSVSPARVLQSCSRRDTGREWGGTHCTQHYPIPCGQRE